VTNRDDNPQATSLGPGLGRTVLVVEDEEALRVMIRRLLQREGYAVLEANNGADAIRLLQESTGPAVELVLTDLRMPLMGGRELAASLARSQPGLPVVLMSGFTAQLRDLQLISPNLALLSKPFRDHDLLATIKAHLEG
jgi:two-component system, cell cycle sensor histidine kinase and response regulator CckA